MQKQLLSLLSAVWICAGINAQGTISFSSKPGTCEDNSATLSAGLIGGSVNTAYVWSNGATGSALMHIGPGTYCVTATDASLCSGGNTACSVSACYTVNSVAVSSSITSIPNGNIALTGGDPNVIYLGYGPQSTNLTASVTGGGNMSYSWAPSAGLSCTNCAAPTFAPTAAGLYNYTVTATNGTCTTTSSISLCVMDIRVPGTNKVYVCHIPPGNHHNPQTISISVNAVSAHVPLHGGDHLGSCEQQCGTDEDDDSEPELLRAENGNSFDVLLYPNPFVGSFHLSIQSPEPSYYSIKLYSLSGQLMEEHNNLDPLQEITLGDDLTKGIYFARITQQNSTRSIRLTKVD